MDGAYEMAGSPTPAEIEGKTYLLGPWTIADSGVIELVILNSRKRPEDILPSVLPKFEKEQQRTILEVAYKDWLYGPRVKEDECVEFLQTRKGEVLRLYLLLKKNHPEMTFEEAGRLRDLALDTIGRAIRESGQQVGNSSAPDTAGAMQTQANSPPIVESSVT